MTDIIYELDSPTAFGFFTLVKFGHFIPTLCM